MHLVHLYEAFNQSSSNICRMVEMTGFVLIELRHGDESIWNTCAVDDGPKRLSRRCICLEQCHFSVADRNQPRSARRASYLTWADASYRITETRTSGLHDTSNLRGRPGKEGRPRRCSQVASQEDCQRPLIQLGRLQQPRRRISAEDSLFCAY